MKLNARVLIVIFLLAIASIFFIRTSEPDTYLYTTYLKRQSPIGLSVEGAVVMNDVQVGEIVEIGVGEENVEAARVVMELSAGAPVKTDTRVVVVGGLFNGAKVVSLVGSSNSSKLLRDVTPKGEPLVIGEGLTRAERMVERVRGLAPIKKQIGEIVDGVGASLRDIVKSNKFEFDREFFQRTEESLRKEGVELSQEVLSSLSVFERRARSLSEEQKGSFVRELEVFIAELGIDKLFYSAPIDEIEGSVQDGFYIGPNAD